MKYDFKTLTDRKGTHSLKWDLFDDEYPMWVADMDFKVAPAIYESIKNRINHPIFAYSIECDELFESYINWWDRRYDFKMNKENLMFFSGVMPSITSAIRCLTNTNDKILIQTPVYHVFFSVINDNNRQIIENKLIYNNGEYMIDFDDLEDKLSDNVKMFILCNPHNPIGKLWSRSELSKIGELCKKYDVILISDEIHCDLTDPNIKYIPFEQAFSYDKAITCLSPTKTFNIAGLQSAVIHTKNENFFSKIKTQRTCDFFHHPGAFSINSTIAAYNDSEDWLDELREVIYKNKLLVNEFLSNNIPDLKLVLGNATYLLWIDCSSLNTQSRILSQFLRDNQSLFLSPGIQFGENGDNFLRMNIACPEKLLKEGLEKLKAGILEFKKFID